MNDWIAIRANQVFATMGFAYFCTLLVLLPLLWPASMAVVQYLSSGVIQLVALPLLGVGTILAARASDALAKEQHDAAMEAARETKAIMEELHAMHQEMHTKLDGLDAGSVA